MPAILTAILALLWSGTLSLTEGDRVVFLPDRSEQALHLHGTDFADEIHVRSVSGDYDGGGGADTFIFDEFRHSPVIDNFETGIDKLELHHSMVPKLALGEQDHFNRFLKLIDSPDALDEHVLKYDPDGRGHHKAYTVAVIHGDVSAHEIFVI